MPNLNAMTAPETASPFPAPIVLPPDLLAALRKMDANEANWQPTIPDMWKGVSDATGDEEGLD
jgi:hypothetical protein